MVKDRTLHNTDSPADEVTELAVDLALALSADPDGRVSACPDPEILAAMAENRLPETERLAVLEHLDRCPACRDAWLLAASEPVMAKPAPRTARSWLTGRVLAGGSVTAAVAACLIWFFLIHPMTSVVPPYATKITHGYGALLDDGPLYASARQVAKALAEETVTRSGGESATSKAFTSGWNSGLTTVDRGFAERAAGPDVASLEYVSSIGRWVALLSIALQTDPEPGREFWKEQARVPGMFLKDSVDFARTGDDRRIRRAFEALEKTLKSLGHVPSSDGKDLLRRQLNGLAHLMRQMNVAEE